MKNLNDPVITAMQERVYDANMMLSSSGLVKLTWGNVSEINRELGIVVIKPSGVAYAELVPKSMVIMDLEGNLLQENPLRPSSDYKTHLLLYKEFTEITAVVHSHSKFAVAWSQSGRSLPVYGTTHADSFYGEVPMTDILTEEEVNSAYELHTGNVIVRKFTEDKLKPLEVPGVLVNGHGPFTWGTSPMDAVNNNIILEEICEMALYTELLSKQDNLLPQYVLDKHYERKHGPNAYYGQS